jgi:hypothetical protein
MRTTRHAVLLTLGNAGGRMMRPSLRPIGITCESSEERPATDLMSPVKTLRVPGPQSPVKSLRVPGPLRRRPHQTPDQRFLELLAVELLLLLRVQRHDPLAARVVNGPGDAIGRVIASAFLFIRKTTSDLGWSSTDFIVGGRIKDSADDTGASGGAEITRIDRPQLAACTYKVLPGPGKLLRWSVLASRDTTIWRSARR